MAISEEPVASRSTASGIVRAGEASARVEETVVVHWSVKVCEGEADDADDGVGRGWGAR